MSLKSKLENESRIIPLKNQLAEIENSKQMSLENTILKTALVEVSKENHEVIQQLKESVRRLHTLHQQAEERQMKSNEQSKKQIDELWRNVKLLSDNLSSSVQNLSNESSKSISSLNQSVLAVDDKIKSIITDNITATIQQTVEPMTKSMKDEFDKQMVLMQEQTKKMSNAEKAMQNKVKDFRVGIKRLFVLDAAREFLFWLGLAGAILTPLWLFVIAPIIAWLS